VQATSSPNDKNSLRFSLFSYCFLHAQEFFKRASSHSAVGVGSVFFVIDGRLSNSMKKGASILCRSLVGKFTTCAPFFFWKIKENIRVSHEQRFVFKLFMLFMVWHTIDRSHDVTGMCTLKFMFRTTLHLRTSSLKRTWGLKFDIRKQAESTFFGIALWWHEPGTYGVGWIND